MSDYIKNATKALDEHFKNLNEDEFKEQYLSCLHEKRYPTMKPFNITLYDGKLYVVLDKGRSYDIKDDVIVDSIIGGVRYVPTRYVDDGIRKFSIVNHLGKYVLVLSVHSVHSVCSVCSDCSDDLFDIEGIDIHGNKVYAIKEYCTLLGTCLEKYVHWSDL